MNTKIFGQHDEATIEAPTLDGTLDGLRAELERMLIGAGLFPKEALAMVETWRDSWFEEGTEFGGVPVREPLLAAQPVVAR